MRIFIVTSKLTSYIDLSYNQHISRLVNQLDTIKIYDKDNLHQVVMVDELYSLTTDLSQPTSFHSFMFSDFFHQTPETPINKNIDINCIYEQVKGVDRQNSYIVIDCGLHPTSEIEDFIDKLAKVFFQFPMLTSHHFVLIVPLAIQPQIARKANTSFNNIPITECTNKPDNKTQMLSTLTLLKKAHLKMPFLAWPIVKAIAYYRFILGIVRSRGNS